MLLSLTKSQDQTLTFSECESNSVRVLSRLHPFSRRQTITFNSPPYPNETLAIRIKVKTISFRFLLPLRLAWSDPLNDSNFHFCKRDYGPKVVEGEPIVPVRERGGTGNKRPSRADLRQYWWEMPFSPTGRPSLHHLPQMGATIQHRRCSVKVQSENNNRDMTAFKTTIIPIFSASWSSLPPPLATVDFCLLMSSSSSVIQLVLRRRGANLSMGIILYQKAIKN